ncbi:MAG: class I SAM-dependent methyltransferase [Cyanobacteria bacterium SZAS LIN-5]|nr:class I SAM-dependent methyltransferase [Cyanobacteria bacterium SZAS LIN-5]
MGSDDSLKKMTRLYEIPLLYDLAFRRMAITNNVDGLLACHERFGSEHELKNVLELAAGPSRHALEFASRGYLATAIDNSPSMCFYATKLAGDLSVPLNVNNEDMLDFNISENFDLAFILLNSIGHVHTATDLTRHLAAVSRHLSRDGLYVVEAHYPHWSGRESIKQSSWPVELEGIQLNVDFGATDDEFDVDTRVRSLKLHIYGSVMGNSVDLADHLMIRSWSADCFEETVAESGFFEIAAKLSSLDPDQPFNPAEAGRLVYVLKKKDGLLSQNASKQQ